MIRHTEWSGFRHCLFNLHCTLLVPLVAATSLAGCASAPKTAVATAPEPAPVTAVAAVKGGEKTKFPGYRLVELDGKEVYCRRETASGSRLTQRTICVTEEQLRQESIGNQRAMETFNRRQVPSSDSGSAVTHGPGG